MYRPLGILMALFAEELPKGSKPEPPPVLRDVDDISGVEVRLSFTFLSFPLPIPESITVLIGVDVSALSLLFTFPMLLEGNCVDNDDDGDEDDEDDAEVAEVDDEVVELKT